MKRTQHINRAMLTVPLAAAMCLPLTGGAVSAQSVMMEPDFDDAFATFDTQTIAPPQVPDDAVDITSFDPPLEPKPKPKPKPRSVKRSLGTGVASYYGKRFHGRLTANGERFNMNAMTAAHKTLPFGTRVRVTNPRNGKSVTVRINDRGPFIRGRHIDLSRAAAQRIGMISSGHARVKMDIVGS